MKKTIISFITVIALSTFVSNNSYGQCGIVLDTAIYNGLTYFNPDTINICLNESVYFHATGGCPTYLAMNDFNDGTIGTGWSSGSNPMFNNPCGTGPDSTYLWIGPASNFPRELISGAYLVINQCQVCFDMKYSVQAGGSPCEGPDLQTEGVHLQYSDSINGTWTDISYWDPLGGYDPYLTTWHQYCENFPLN